MNLISCTSTWDLQLLSIDGIKILGPGIWLLNYIFRRGAAFYQCRISWCIWRATIFVNTTSSKWEGTENSATSCKRPLETYLRGLLMCRLMLMFNSCFTRGKANVWVIVSKYWARLRLGPVLWECPPFVSLGLPQSPPPTPPKKKPSAHTCIINRYGHREKLLWPL
jgi:hypothetical protein